MIGYDEHDNVSAVLLCECMPPPRVDGDVVELFFSSQLSALIRHQYVLKFGSYFTSVS